MRIHNRIIQQEWCEKWLLAQFQRLPDFANGIEREHLFHLAESAGLYIPGTYNSPMSHAIEKLTIVESVRDQEGNFLYHAFRLAS